MAAVTTCSDFGAPKNKVWHCFHCFPIYLPWSDGTMMPWSSFSECWALSQLFHSPLSLSSRASFVLYFLSQGWCHLHIWGYWYFSQKSWFQLVLYPAWHFTWCKAQSVNHLPVWGYWYFLPEILIPACASSSPAFPMMFPAYKLNKQGDVIQPWCTPFLIWNQSVVACLFPTVASWPAYRFLRM